MSARIALVLALVAFLLTGCGQLGFPDARSFEGSTASLVESDLADLPSRDAVTFSLARLDSLEDLRYGQFVVAFEALGAPEGSTLESQIATGTDERLLVRVVDLFGEDAELLTWTQDGALRGMAFVPGTVEPVAVVR